MQITLKNWDLNAAAGSLTAEFEFVPANPIEHEVLTELLTDQALEKAFAHTTHDRGQLGIKLIVSDTKAFARAQHNLENLRRKDAGLPSLEQEAAAKTEAEAAKAAAEAAAEAEAKAAATGYGAPAQQPPAEPAPPVATLSSGYAEEATAKPAPRPAGKPKQSDK